MLIKSFQINHRKLKPGVYLHFHQQFGESFITTFDLRFKYPNAGDFLSQVAAHSLEHLIATYYTQTCPEKIYFGPMGCMTGFYLVVYGKKDIDWLLSTFKGLDKFIYLADEIPGCNAKACGNYKTLNLQEAKKEWNSWYSKKDNWETEYPK